MQFSQAHILPAPVTPIAFTTMLPQFYGDFTREYGVQWLQYIQYAEEKGLKEYIKENRHRAVLFLILAAAGFLCFYDIGREGYSNEYYSAAVKSMLQSRHNFFFVSFDPGGYVSVDKPALGLWLQALSAQLFGFHGWSLILPEALSTVISVAVLYHLVQRAFGKNAGLLSALALALSPVLIAVSRTNNLDASLLMVLMLAAWSLLAAAEKGSFALLLLSMALAGLGFNIKMLQAYMVLPAFYLVYLLIPSLRAGRKVLHLAGATAVLLVVSLSWAMIVDATPADRRPYVGSSRTNSVIELALGYNGIQRVLPSGNPAGAGMPDGNGRNGNGPAPGNMPGVNPPDENQPGRQALPNGADMQRRAGAGTGVQPGAQMQAAAPNPPGGVGGPAGGNMPGGPGGAPGGGGPGNEGGKQGILRIFNEQMAGQISWLIPMALFGLVAGFLNMRRRLPSGNKRAAAALLLWGGWIAAMLAYFSIAGFFHRYYLSMLAPGIAALAGIGGIELYRAYAEEGWKGFLLPAALLANAAVQGVILSRYLERFRILLLIVCGISTVSALALLVIKVWNRGSGKKAVVGLAAAGFAALLAAPAFWSATPLLYGLNASIPVAGPSENRDAGRGGGPRTGNPAVQNNELSDFTKFLVSKKQKEKYLLAVPDVHSAASMILQTGEPVMAVGGFLGTDPILTAARLEKMVKDGELRYFQIGNRGAGPQSEVSQWVTEHGTAVSSAAWAETGPGRDGENRRDGMGAFEREMGNETLLYDLAAEKQ